MQLAAVTYTHNDAELLDGLFENLLRSSVWPQQVFIFDDCSGQPYVLPAALAQAFAEEAKRRSLGKAKTAVANSDISASSTLNPNFNSGLNSDLNDLTSHATLPSQSKAPAFSLIRFETQRGPAQAKKYALDFVFKAGAEVVLSLDCDIRPHPRWLEQALPLLKSSEVGLVGADIAHGLAGDALSRYLRAFEQPRRELLQVPFLPAGIWLMRRDTWLGTGGLDGHEQFTHEDLFFCRRLHEFNLRLLALNTLPVTQVRRLNRQAHMRRELSYLGFALLGACRKEGAKQALLPVKERSQQRLQAALAKIEPSFIYLELLWLLALLYWLAQREALGEKTAVSLEQLSSVLREIFAGYPETLSLLGEDLHGLGLIDDCCLQTFAVRDNLNNLNIALPGGTVATLARDMLDFWLINIDICDLLEAKGVPAILKNDSEFEFATHYLKP